MIFLVTDRRVIPFDRAMNLEASRRFGNGPFLANLHFDLAAKGQDRPGLALSEDTHMRDRFGKRAGTSIHDRNFSAVDFDHGVVDSHSLQSREHMLDGADLHRTAT